jgi:hypothetical protein
MGYDGRIRIDSSVDSRGFNKGISGMTASVGRLAAALGVALGIGAVVSFGKASVDAAAAMSNAFIGLQSILEGQGKSFATAKTFIDDFISDGLVPVTDAVTAYKQLAARGYDTTQIEQTLVALKNSAAFGRQASLSIGDAVRSATEGLKNENSILVDNAGVTKNVSIMWREYAESIGTNAAALTKEQKIEAEVQGIMQETRFQMGDAAKLSGTYSGKIAALGVSFNNLKVAVGNSIIPIINQLLPYIKAAVDALTVFFNRIATIMNAIFGTNISMADTISATTEATTEAAAAENELADATTEAGKAAKGALASFDQLNVLQQDTSTTGTAADTATETPVTLPSIDDTAIDAGLSALEEKLSAFKLEFMELVQPVIDAFYGLRDALTPLGETIWAGMKWAWDNILVPLGKWTITDLLPAFLDLLGGAAELLNSVLLALQPAWLWFWDNVLQPLAVWVGGVIVSFIEGLTKVLYGLSDWIDNNQETFATMTLIVAGFIAAWEIYEFAAGVAALTVKLWLQVAAWAASTAAKLADKIETLAIMALYAGDFLVKLGLSVAAVWGEVTAWAAATAAKFAANAQLLIMNVTTGIWTGIAWLASAATTAFGAAMAFLASPIGLIILLIVGIIAVIWLLIENWEQLSTTVKQILFLLGYYISTYFLNPLLDGFFKTLDFIEDKFITIFTAVKDFIKGIINDIIGFINGMIDSVISGINAVIDAANSVGSVIGGENFSPIATLSAPQIPQLATGAVIPPNARFAAILGDQKSGNNLEAPESLLRQIVREESGGSGQNVTITFEGSLSELARVLKPHIDYENSRVGGSLLKGSAA